MIKCEYCGSRLVLRKGTKTYCGGCFRAGVESCNELTDKSKKPTRLVL